MHRTSSCPGLQDITNRQTRLSSCKTRHISHLDVFCDMKKEVNDFIDSLFKPTGAITLKQFEKKEKYLEEKRYKFQEIFMRKHLFKLGKLFSPEYQRELKSLGITTYDRTEYRTYIIKHQFNFDNLSNN